MNKQKRFACVFDAVDAVTLASFRRKWQAAGELKKLTTNKQQRNNRKIPVAADALTASDDPRKWAKLTEHLVDAW